MAASQADNSIIQEEDNFNKLFQAILRNIRSRDQHQENVSDIDIASAIKQMKEGFKSFTFPDMEQWQNVFGYLFRYAPHGAGLTRNRVLAAVRGSNDLALCLQKTDLSIVSLGGGPGNDIIGFCSALVECVERSQCLDTSRKLNITVVDQYSKWSICIDHLNNLVREGEFGNVSRLFRSFSVNMSFFQAEISPNYAERYLPSLQRADVILMVKLISSMKMPSVDYLVNMLKRNMKDDALLLYIDGTIQMEVAAHFDVLFQSNLGNYCMGTKITEMFDSDDYFESKAQIAVLRKPFF